MAASIAAGLGFASAAVSAYWALGGTGLVDTVGGEIERWGRERSVGVVAALWTIVVFKLAFAGVGTDHRLRWTRAPGPRLLGWLAAVGITVYGGVLSVVGLLVEAGVVEPADNADEHALAWHAYFWDPWFALWGVAFTVVMWCTRSGVRRGRRRSAVAPRPPR